MRRAVLVVLISSFCTAGVAEATEDALSRAMQEELARNMAKLKFEELERPYFVSYTVDEVRWWAASATFGSLISSDQGHHRRLNVEVRVGDYEFDNTNFHTRSLPPSRGFGFFGGSASLPLEDDEREVRRLLWLGTDIAYKDALERFSRKRAALQNRTRTETLADFSRQEPARTTDEAPAVVVELADQEALVRDLSALFKEMPDVSRSTVTFSASTVRTRYLNSEGTSYTRTTPSVFLTVRAAAQAPDGLPLTDYVAAFGRSVGDLPSKGELEKAIRAMGRHLSALQRAPTLDRYNGPVLFEGQAAAELLAQVLAPRLLARRPPVAEAPGHAGVLRVRESFADKIGGRVLPRFLSLEDDPTLTSFDGRTLYGSYSVDDEGVPAGKTQVVTRGILKTLLSGRTPIRGVTTSTGNRRGGVKPSNVVLSVADPMSDEELRQELMLLVEEREAEYGLMVRRIDNPGLGSRQDAVSFGRPGGSRVAGLLEVYRIYPDGSEELVRNVELAGIEISNFKEIVAASEERIVYSAPFGRGRSSFRMPGSLSSWVVPSLLFEDLTLKKPQGEVPNPPVLPHPYFEDPLDPDEPLTRAGLM